MDADLGGSGGDSPPPLTARDTRMVERALRQRWPIPEGLRERLPAELAKVIESRRASHRNKIAAARALLEADKLNLEQERRDQGGDTLNVNVSGSVRHEHHDLSQLSVEELRALESLLLRALPGGGAGGTGGTQPD